VQTGIVEPLPPRKTPAFVDLLTSAPASTVIGWTAFIVALGFGYASTWRSLIQTWSTNDNYNYGFLVVPIALYILWNRRELFNDLKPSFKPLWPALGFIVATLGLKFWLYERNESILENLTLLPLLAGVAVLAGGWQMLRFAWPAIAYMIFMFPLPERINSLLSYNLQSFATMASCSILQMIGRPAIYEGNVILMSGYMLEVARACSGLSMLLTFVALITAMVLVTDKKRMVLWQRIVLVLSSVPIALASNVIRIVVTALCYPIFGPVKVEQFAHDFAGWAMMPIGLALAWAELSLLDWLVVKEQVVDHRMLLPGMRGLKNASPSPRS
jgi:exosortase